MPETTHYHDRPQHSVGAKDTCAGHAGTVKSCNFDTEAAQYKCVHNEKSGCFITTAVLGSEMDPEVRLLHRLRDDVIRGTRWGDRFFADYFEIYNRVSPDIAARIEMHPETKAVLRWSVIRPWLNYLHLMMRRPREWRLEGVDPELRGFLEAMRADMESWLAEIPLPEDFRELPAADAARELAIVLHFVVRGREREYLERLAAAGALPLRVDPRDRDGLDAFLDELGLAPDLRAALLGAAPAGTTP